MTPIQAAVEFLDDAAARNLLGLHRIRVGGEMLDRAALADLLRKEAERPKANPDATNAAIQFALAADEGMVWLGLWNEGSFEACRREWPEAPDECYIGADQFFQPEQDGASGG